jgi:hypothetical protein
MRSGAFGGGAHKSKGFATRCGASQEWVREDLPQQDRDSFRLFIHLFE